MLEIGSSLREARRRRELELAQVERATRIRVAQLEALEQEHFERLPPDPYRRSFLREYADFLGLDSDLYTTEYDRRFHPPEPAVPAPRRRSADTSRLLARGPLPAITVIALVLVGAAVWWLGRSGGKPVVRIPTTLTQTRKHPHHRATQQPKPAPAQAPVLVFTAVRGSCWLLVRVGSATGPTIYQQTLQSGRTLRFGLHRRLWIRLGAPWNIEATIGRNSLTLPSQISDVLATAAGLEPTR
jgi:cytoskeleton protein RodZ